MIKILVTGSNGLLGQKLVYALKNDVNVQLIATAKGQNRLVNQEGYAYVEMDISNREQVKEVVHRFAPDCIIHTAAMTNVDACETEKELCRKLNVDAVEYLVEAVESFIEKRIHFIHLSTDFIFDGKNGPYKEEDKANPLSFYGQSKADAEEIVKLSKTDWCIIRTIIVFGITDNMSRSNIVLWAREALSNNKHIKVVDDQFRSPTLAEDLAEGCILAAKKRATGIYHVSGKETMSILELVKKVAAYFHLQTDTIEVVKSETLNQPAKRPPKTGFIIEKAVRELGYRPHSFEESIQIVYEQFKAFEQQKK